ncbi:MAG: hypothetical protein OXH79_04395 [Boseongicola sp.]|nr:hypothetical protein [Boseongicola sp.]
MRSFRRKGRCDHDPLAARHVRHDCHSEQRSNANHSSAADTDAPLFRKRESQSPRLSCMGHLLKERPTR